MRGEGLRQNGGVGSSASLRPLVWVTCLVSGSGRFGGCDRKPSVFSGIWVLGPQPLMWSQVPRQEHVDFPGTLLAEGRQLSGLLSRT